MVIAFLIKITKKEIKFHMKTTMNYDMLISDMYKIYLYCINLNNVKKFQPINNKYTTIDTTMLACYIFFKLVQDENLNINDAKIIIRNELIKKLINYSTGNLEGEMENLDQKRNRLYKISNKKRTVKILIQKMILEVPSKSSF